jgi:hypothetical protein
MSKNDVFVPRSDSSEYQSFKNLVNELRQHLQDQSVNNNTFTISDFKQYEPLFNRDVLKTLHKDELIRLAREYLDKIDPYAEIKVISDDDSNKILFTLPPLFLPVEKLSTNSNNLKTLESIKSIKSKSDPVLHNKTIYEYAVELLRNQMSDQHKSLIKEYKIKTQESIESIQKFLTGDYDNELTESTDNSNSDILEDENISWE